MNQECNTFMEDVNDDDRDTLQRVPLESLDALLGYRFYHLASAVKRKHQTISPVARNGSNYFLRKSRKLNPASGVLSETADFLYKTTNYYAPQYEHCIQWNDPDLAIDWPLTEEPILSAKDEQGIPFRQAQVYP